MLLQRPRQRREWANGREVVARIAGRRRLSAGPGRAATTSAQGLAVALGEGLPDGFGGGAPPHPHPRTPTLPPPHPCPAGRSKSCLPPRATRARTLPRHRRRCTPARGGWGARGTGGPPRQRGRGRTGRASRRRRAGRSRGQSRCRAACVAGTGSAKGWGKGGEGSGWNAQQRVCAKSSTPQTAGSPRGQRPDEGWGVSGFHHRKQGGPARKTRCPAGTMCCMCRPAPTSCGCA